MNIWPFSRKGEVETRSGYSDLLLSGLIAQAEGGTTDPRRTAALEIAAGLWSRAFAMAQGGEPYLAPDVLADIGRALVRDGECVCIVHPGEPLEPVVLVNVEGGPKPSTWTYNVQSVGPSKTEARTLTAGNVLHFRYASHAATPWIGVPPWRWALDTSEAVGFSERLAVMESMVGAAYLLPGRRMNDEEFYRYKEALASIMRRGGVFSPEARNSAGGEEQWSVTRIGANPPDGVVSMRHDSAVQLLGACGVHPGLVGIERGEGTATREVWRQFLYATIAPVARLAITSEMNRKLGTEITLTFEDLNASDIQGRARSYASLIKAGMKPEKAEKLCGF